MLAKYLRRILAVEAILLLLGAVLLVRAGASSPAAAAALALALFVCLNAGVFIAGYALSLRYASEPPEGLEVPLRTACRVALVECLAALALFVLFQPFERWWMAPDAPRRQSPGRTPVLLIHGYLCNRGLWWWLRRGLEARGVATATVDLEPPLSGIDDLAESLHARMQALRPETGGDRVVLIGHSMGGLVARAYMRRYGVEGVAKLITLGSPHHGTELARFAIGQNAREMQPDSHWIRELSKAEPPPVPTINVWSARDNFVAPQDSSRLAGAQEIVLPVPGHLSMVFSPEILEILVRELPSLPPAERAHRAI
jgi:triacylglycerol lipase